MEETRREGDKVQYRCGNFQGGRLLQHWHVSERKTYIKARTTWFSGLPRSHKAEAK